MAVHSRGNELLAREAEFGDAARMLSLRRVYVLHASKELCRGNVPETNAVILAAGSKEVAIGRGGEAGDGSSVTLECGLDSNVFGGGDGD